MNFRFIYVEDRKEDRASMRAAVANHNKKKDPIFLDMITARDPEGLRAKLKEQKEIDLVLADLHYEEGRNCLDEIVDAVEAWCSREPSRSPIPIVAYTAYGPIEEAIREGRKLFDIVDKNSASPEYITWRLSRIALDLSRLRPDTVLQRLIREMSTGASWHDCVVRMPDAYNIGETEAGQLKGIESSIGTIGNRMRVYPAVRGMWQTVMQSEQLERATSASRGHARHVVNVFWMGYWLIHNERLAPWFATAWKTTLLRRSTDLNETSAASRQRVEFIKAIDRNGSMLESISCAWFFAALFHDVAGCVPSYPKIRNTADSVVRGLGCTVKELDKDWVGGAFSDKANLLFDEMDPEEVSAFRPLWESSVASGRPDHGVLAALHLRDRITEEHQLVNAFEASRAVAVHNLIGQLGESTAMPLDWSRQPLSCLLVMLDQIQTWERHRGDEDIWGPDLPSKAQLDFMEVDSSPFPKLEMRISYVVPRQFEHSRILYDRLEQDLQTVLHKNPNEALLRISSREWPFELKVRCFLGEKELIDPLHFGGREGQR